MIYVVKYTNEDCVGNDCKTLFIEADNREHAFEILDEQYPNLEIDCVYTQETK